MPQVVKIVTPPATSPVSLAEAKAHLRVSFDDDDDLITTLIDAARRLCEVAGRCVTINTTFDLVDDGFPANSGYINRLLRANPVGFQGGFYSSPPSAFYPQNVGAITVPRVPLVSVSSITYLDSNGASQTLTPSTDYVVTTGNPGRIAPAFGKVWPVTLPQIGVLTIRFVAGYGTSASDVPSNVKQAILLTVGHLYQNREAVVTGTITAELPLGVMHLLGIETQGGYA